MTICSIILRLRKNRIGRICERKIRLNNRRMISIGDTNRTFWKPGWETVDLLQADYLCDIRTQKLPFKNESVDLINCSHIIEHLPYPQSSSHFFFECLRILKPTGVMRISTPDAALLVEKYKRKDWRFFLACDGKFILNCVIKGKIPPEALLLHNRLVGWFASYSGRLDSGGSPVTSEEEVSRHLKDLSIFEFGNWCTSLLQPNRVFAHVNLYDRQRLVMELQDAGYRKVYPSMYGESSISEFNRFNLDREKHRLYSFYLDAFKEQ